MAIKIMDNNKFGVVSLSMSKEADIEVLKRDYLDGYATGSTAILYMTDGNMRIFNFIASEDKHGDGQWVEMI